MTAADFITDVLRQLAIISEIETPSAEQGQDALTKLNDLMADLAEDGVDFGYNPKATTAEDLILPDGQKRGLKAMLGMSLADGYGLPVPPVMGALASAWYKRAIRRVIQTTQRQLTTDAPRGERQWRRYNILTGY